MKKLVLAITVAVLGMAACKEEKETPAPTKARYEYKRTPGVVDEIIGDIFVDTGMTMFTVKGSGFDPKKKKYYHLLLRNKCAVTEDLNREIYLNGFVSKSNYADTAKLLQITDSTIVFLVANKDIYDIRYISNAGLKCIIVDTVEIDFGITSKDSSNMQKIVTNLNILGNKKVRNKLFFNILKDTLTWHKNRSPFNYRDFTITLDDIKKEDLNGNVLVDLYFNNSILSTPYEGDNYMVFYDTTRSIGDGVYIFAKPLYDQNSALNLNDGFYNITMKERSTGIPIEERRGKKGVYVKFVD